MIYASIVVISVFLTVMVFSSLYLWHIYQRCDQKLSIALLQEIQKAKHAILVVEHELVQKFGGWEKK